MIDYKQLNSETINQLELSTIKTHKNISYYNIESAFDIETSSLELEGRKLAHMYVWAFGIGYNNTIYYGRTWDEFIDLTNNLVEWLGLSLEKRLVIYVHNLGYEFQFMRKYFEWENVFAVKERKPLKATTINGIEFRDSYLLSGYSLDNTAKNLNTHKVEKLIGDLDYDLVRHHNTPLTDKEMGYVENDIKVVNAYINEQIAEYGNITKIPLTNTGRVRKYVKDACYYTSKNHKKTNKGKYGRYRKLMLDLTLSDDYTLLKRSFMGGFTHANANHVGQVINNVSSFDFTSSYPAVMISEPYPMSRGFTPKIESKEDFKQALNNYLLVMDIEFINITSKITQEQYLSQSKCYELEKPIINNGRVVSADRLLTTITNVDYSIMEHAYNWDNIKLYKVVAYHKGFLPKSIVESVLNLYQDKTTLKGVVGKEVEYLLSKGMLNSTYGMTVTDIVKDNHVYSDSDDEWDIEKVNLEEEIENYNQSKNRFLYYPWGVFITAYARRNLWTGILSIGDDYIYSDTDSIKFLNYEKHIDYFQAYNDNIYQKMLNVLNYHKLDPNLLSPKTIKGETKTIGIWDYEGTYSRFKTLGAKRYLIEEDEKLEITVAGLSKQNGLKYLLDQANNDNSKVFDMFNDEMYIPAENTGKSTHTYIDTKQKYYIKDYLNQYATIESESAIHLEQAEYTLSMSREFKQFLSMLSKGYIYKGVKYE